MLSPWMECRWTWGGPTALRDRFLGPVGKAMGFLGSSGYAKRSTKMALAVVWPKMKAPRVTKRTP